MFNTVYEFFRFSLPGFIRNLIKWMPILWTDRDWDNDYIYNVLRFKIGLVADSLEKSKYFEGYERRVEKMRLVCRLIQLVREEAYSTEYLQYLLQKMSVDKDSGLLQIDTLEDNLDEYFKLNKLTYKRVLSKYPQRSRGYHGMMVSEEKHNKARRLIFKLLDNYIESWWW